MELLTKTLFLCLALALTNGDPVPTEDPVNHDLDFPDRCEGEGTEFDAITPDEKGNIFFFKGSYLWTGYVGPAHLSNESFAELDDIHHIGHIDAAFRMHNEENVGDHDHDHIYFFLDDHVFSFYNHTLEEGYPKNISEDFPGIPDHLDAAVECPKGECTSDSALFFKGHDVYVFDIATKTVKTKTYPHLPVCTAVLRWMEHYYCFHGHNFTRFHPVTGEVSGNYPKDARNYFMKCPGRGHGADHEFTNCTDVKIDAITTDDAGKSYLFEGPIYMRLDTPKEGRHPFPITRTWAELDHGLDAAFSYKNTIYMIKDEQVYIYKVGVYYILIEGYPKSLKEELGITGHVDAAFVCPDHNDTVHLIQGNMMRDVDLNATPRVVTREVPLPFSDIDAGTCDDEGLTVYKGSHFYHYDSPMLLAMSKIAPMPQDVTHDMTGCQE